MRHVVGSKGRRTCCRSGVCGRLLLSGRQAFAIAPGRHLRRLPLARPGDRRRARPSGRRVSARQAVGGLSLEQAIQCPAYGAPLVVLGAPLTIDADAFKTADGNLEASLRMICEKVHAYGDVAVH